MDSELMEQSIKERQRQDRKKAKLLQSFENNLQISSLDLHNKFDSFES